MYAHRSGLVTLPTLKRQLQHITQEMSMYYARGSAFAKGFIDTDKTHFAKEWAEAQGLSGYLPTVRVRHRASPDPTRPGHRQIR